MDPVRKSDQKGLLFTRDRSGTGPERIQTDPNKTGPAFLQVQSWIRSVPVPERSRVNRIRSGPVRFGTVPVRSRENIA